MANPRKAAAMSANLPRSIDAPHWSDAIPRTLAEAAGAASPDAVAHCAFGSSLRAMISART